MTDFGAAGNCSVIVRSALPSIKIHVIHAARLACWGARRLLVMQQIMIHHTGHTLTTI